MTTADLPHSTPSAAGVDAAGIEAFLDALESASDVEPHSVIVLRHGSVIAEGWWAPYTPERVHLLYSMSKSFASTAAGLAVAEGLLDLDATVLSYFPEFDADIVDRRSRAMKVRHAAAMSSGHLTETLARAVQNDPYEPVRGFLQIPPDRDPGTVFAYNQPCTYSVGAIVQREAGQTLIDYLRPRLFEPLGIGEARWISDQQGRNLGFSGLHLTTDALARLGQLYLQRGRWGDQQILDPAWVDEATSKQVDNNSPDEPSVDWRQGYGFQFWMGRHGYRGDGAFGQFCLVLPEQDLVIATTAASVNMQAMLDAVWTHVLPALDPASPDPAADQRLADRLAAAALSPVDGADEPPDAGKWDGLTCTVEPPEPSPDLEGFGAMPPAISSVGLRRGDEGWRLTVSDAGGRLEAGIGCGEWAVEETGGLPVAVSGGWTDAGTFAAVLRFLETPHAVLLTCSPDGTATALWPTVPLHGRSLLELRSPVEALASV